MMTWPDIIAYMRDIAEDQGSVGRSRLREISDAIKHEQEDVAPFREWAQEWLDPGKWAGHSLLDAVRQECEQMRPSKQKQHEKPPR